MRLKIKDSLIITVHGDGKRTLRAHCEIDDPPTVLRDVILSLDADNYPMDCFVRLAIDDRFEGSGWMRFSETYAEAALISGYSASGDVVIIRKAHLYFTPSLHPGIRIWRRKTMNFPAK